MAGPQTQVVKPEHGGASQLHGCRRDLQVGMEMICLGGRGWAAVTGREFINRHYKNLPWLSKSFPPNPDFPGTFHSAALRKIKALHWCRASQNPFRVTQLTSSQLSSCTAGEIKGELPKIWQRNGKNRRLREAARGSASYSHRHFPWPALRQRLRQRGIPAEE